MKEILEEIVHRADAGETAALCVVVRTQGSTPQTAGAAMMVMQNGATLGTLGGGCVEAEVRTRALQLASESQTQLLQFSLDQDYGWDDGLVCGGVMEIAVQVISSPADAGFARTVLETVSLNQIGTLTFHTDSAGGREIFAIPVLPVPRLLIAGAGHVGFSLSQIAMSIGFQVTVIDDRADFAVAARFPQANCIIGDIEKELVRCRIDPLTYVTIVTRGHRHDAQALAAVIDSPAAYVGLIGSKRKIVQIFKDLHQQGVSAEKLRRVHAPIGLEIGAVTPGEIAVSIASELIAVRRGHGNKAAAPMKMSFEQLDRLLKPVV